MQNEFVFASRHAMEKTNADLMCFHLLPGLSCSVYIYIYIYAYVNVCIYIYSACLHIYIYICVCNANIPESIRFS